MHLKREEVPKNWPIERKGKTFVVRPNFSAKRGIPILIVLRDVLKIAENRKEVKRALHLKQILVNSKIAHDDKNCLTLFDILTIIPLNKSYKLILTKKGKFGVEEIKENQIGKKIIKITDKKILNGKKIQLNLGDGRNLLTDTKCNINDSILVNLKDKKIEKIIPLKESSNIIVFSGKHAGEEGIVKSIDSKKKIAQVELGNEKIDILIKQLMAIE